MAEGSGARGDYNVTEVGDLEFDVQRLFNLPVILFLVGP